MKSCIFSISQTSFVIQLEHKIITTAAAFNAPMLCTSAKRQWIIKQKWRPWRKWTELGRTECAYMCLFALFPGVHAGDRLGKRPLGLLEVWVLAKKSRTKIDVEGKLYLKNQREGERRTQIWRTKRFVSEQKCKENKTLRWRLTNTHSHKPCWVEPYADRGNNGKLWIVRFVFPLCCTGMGSGWKRGWKASMTIDDDQPWEILSRLSSVDRSAPLTAQEGTSTVWTSGFYHWSG